MSPKPLSERPLDGLARRIVDSDWVSVEYGLLPEEAIAQALSGDAVVDLHPLFDSRYYAERVNEYQNGSEPAEVTAPGDDSDPLSPEGALIHYLESLKAGVAVRDTSLAFSPTFYRKYIQDQLDTREPLAHFHHIGADQGRIPFIPEHDRAVTILADPRFVSVQQTVRRTIEQLGLLDTEWYALMNGLGSPAEATEHYWSIGFAEHRPPSPWIDPMWFKETHREFGDEVSPVLFLASNKMQRKSDPSKFLSLKSVWDIAKPKSPIGTAHRNQRPHHFNPSLERVAGPGLGVGLQRVFEPAPNSTVGTAPTPTEASTQDGTLRIEWIIPHFGAVVGGGHAAIFRMAGDLAAHGHQMHFWMYSSSGSPSTQDIEELAQIVQERPGLAEATVAHLAAPSQLAACDADAVIATAWQTAWATQSVPSKVKKFYFVQDFEPHFFPWGTQRMLAEDTYRLEFDFICSSPWLEMKVRERGATEVATFWYAPDRELYRPPPDRQPPSETNDRPILAVYARRETPRRAVDLVEDALTELACRGLEVFVESFGEIRTPASEGVGWGRPGLPGVARGHLDNDGLADLYKRAHIGLVFSATNYSIVPPEMMACGLPVVELASESNLNTYPDGVATLIPPDATQIADALERLLNDAQAWQETADQGLAWVDSIRWEESVSTVQKFIVQRVAQHSADDAQTANSTVASTSGRVATATVVIPTLNGAGDLEELLTSVNDQQTDFDVSVLVVDSMSDDNTVEIASDLGATVVQVERRKFQHGRTRNYAAHVAASPFVAYLTQDAIPDSTGWLAGLVEPLLNEPAVAGVFGRHVAHHDASPITHHRLDQHFAQFDQLPAVLSRQSTVPGIPHKRLQQMMHFYSDNNSCLRRSVWKQYPYPSIPFGEDQVFANRILDAGYAKAYAPDAVVRHSHDFDPPEAFLRARIESRFFRECFGYLLVATPRMLANAVRGHLQRLSNEWVILGDANTEAAFQQQILVDLASNLGTFVGSQGAPTWNLSTISYEKILGERTWREVIDDWAEQSAMPTVDDTLSQAFSATFAVGQAPTDWTLDS